MVSYKRWLQSMPSIPPHHLRLLSEIFSVRSTASWAKNNPWLYSNESMDVILRSGDWWLTLRLTS